MNAPTIWTYKGICLQLKLDITILQNNPFVTQSVTFSLAQGQQGVIDFLGCCLVAKARSKINQPIISIKPALFGKESCQH